MLAAAMSRTNPTAAVSTRSAGRTPATISACSGTRRTRAGVSGVDESAPGGGGGWLRPEAAVPSASACDTDTPSFSRPMALNTITNTWPGCCGAMLIVIGVQSTLS